jgi:hypothetical protein
MQVSNSGKLLDCEKPVSLDEKQAKDETAC